MARVPASAAVPLIQTIYDRNSVGCCLHVVTDDGNIDDASVDWCLQYAIERDCDECAQCAQVLRSMSPTARRKAIRQAHWGAVL